MLRPDGTVPADILEVNSTSKAVLVTPALWSVSGLALPMLLIVSSGFVFLA
jgi:hypothetical protein